MGTAARIGIFLLVWIGIPVGLGFAGYYLVGPRLSQSSIVKPNLVPSATTRKPVGETAKPASGSNVTDVTLPGEDKVTKFEEPEVEVSVTKIGRRSSSRRSKKPKPVEQPAPKPAEAPSDKPQDGGNGDGAKPAADGLTP